MRNRSQPLSNRSKAVEAQKIEYKVATRKIDKVVRETKKAEWVGNSFKEREVAKVVREAAAGYKINFNVNEVVELLKN